MLVETVNTRQIPGEPRRRWFSDRMFDLIVWYAEDNSLYGFQLCYRLQLEEKALTWIRGRGFTHNTVDDGEGSSWRHKMTPILVPDGLFDRDRIETRFKDAARHLDYEIVAFVCSKLAECPFALIP